MRSKDCLKKKIHPKPFRGNGGKGLIFLCFPTKMFDILHTPSHLFCAHPSHPLSHFCPPTFVETSIFEIFQNIQGKWRFSKSKDVRAPPDLQRVLALGSWDWLHRHELATPLSFTPSPLRHSFLSQLPSRPFHTPLTLLVRYTILPLDWLICGPRRENALERLDRGYNRHRPIF